MIRDGLAAAALLAVAVSAGAQTSVRAEVDARKIGKDDQVQLTLTLEGDVNLSKDVSLPALRNLQVAGGPFQSTQVSLVNGALSQQRAFTWVLQPSAVGKAEIGAFTVELASGSRTTEPLSIEVVAGSVRQQAERPRDPFDPFGDDPFDSFLGRRSRTRQPAPKVLVKAVPSRTRLHVGEPLLLTYFIYTQTSITDIGFTDAPQYPGFWSEDLEQPKENPRGEVATLEGERFQRFPILRKLLFPTKAGKLTVPAASFRIGVPRQSFFDPGTPAVRRSSDPVVVSVDPIPEGAGFSGAVGRFRATATLDKSSVALGGAATLRFRVEGSGNLKWIDKGPEVVMPGAKVYPPTTKSELRAGPDGLTGSKTWEFVVVPETTGALQVPPLSFSYFEPSSERLERSETQALSLAVGGAAPAGALPAAAAAAVPLAGARSSRPLRADLDLPARGLRIGARTLAITLFAALLLHVALIGGPRLLDRLSAARGRPAPRRRTRAALADIERVRRDRLGKEAAAAALERVLHEVFGPLEEASRDGERERAARAVLQEVQFLRYAPQLGDYSEKIREVAGRAAELVRRWA